MNFFFFFTEATAPRGATAATFVTWTKLFVIGVVLSAGLVMLALVLYVHSTLIKSAREKYIKDALSGRAPPDDCHPLAAATKFWLPSRLYPTEGAGDWVESKRKTRPPPVPGVVRTFPRPDWLML
jgi:hypothetical protein